MSRFEGYLPLALKTFATRFYSTTSYLTADIRFGKIIQTFQPTWCVDFADDLMLNTSFSAASAFTYEAVASNNALVGGRIPQPGRLNQVAYLLNTVTVGVTVAIAPPGGVFWAGASASNVPGGNGTATYGPLSGCGPITAGDLQATFWALTQAVGSCDAPGWLCTDTLKLGSVSACNVAYLWTLAFAAVPDGASYTIPTSDCSSSPVVPVIVVPNPTHQILLVAVAVDVFSALHQLPPCGCVAPPSPPALPSPPVPPSPPGCPAASVYSGGSCVPSQLWTVGVTITGAGAGASASAISVAVSTAAGGPDAATAVSAASNGSSVTVVVTLPASGGVVNVDALTAAVSAALSSNALLLPSSLSVQVTVSVAPTPPASPPSRRSLAQAAADGAPSADVAATTVDGVSLVVTLPAGTSDQAASAGFALTTPSALASFATAAGAPGASAAVTSPPAVTASYAVTLASPAPAAAAAAAAVTQPALVAAAAAAGLGGSISISSAPALVASAPPSDAKLAPATGGNAQAAAPPASGATTAVPASSSSSTTLLASPAGVAVIAALVAVGLCCVGALATWRLRASRRSRSAASSAAAERLALKTVAANADFSPSRREALMGSTSTRASRLLGGAAAGGGGGAIDGGGASRRDALLGATSSRAARLLAKEGATDRAARLAAVDMCAPRAPPRFTGLLGSDSEPEDAESPRLAARNTPSFKDQEEAEAPASVGVSNQ